MGVLWFQETHIAWLAKITRVVPMASSIIITYESSELLLREEFNY